MGSPWRGGRRSAVCLDLTVGLSVTPEPSPREMESDAIGSRAPSMTREEMETREAKWSQVCEENKSLKEMINLLLYSSQVSSPPSCPAAAVAASPQPTKKRARNSLETANSCDGNSEKISRIHDRVESPSSDGSCRTLKVRRVCMPISPSDSTLVVKDGYQWRKYGQKVTRDNPSPRAYFRCAFAPSCPVKKKVQRSAEDSSVVVATYEGEHNHSPPSSAEASACSAQGGSPLPCSVSISSKGPTVTLDLTRPDVTKICREVVSPEFQRLLVEQMASSLTSDAKFTYALATAITGRIIDHLQEQL